MNNVFKPYRILDSQLNSLPVIEGQLIFTTDTKKIYLDAGMERIEYKGNESSNNGVVIPNSNLVNGIATGSMRSINSTAEDDNYKLGANALAIGENTKASGKYSFAEGDHSQATSFASHAEGYGSHAIGAYSHTEGNGTYAQGSTSHAEGLASYATGVRTHAEGNSTHAEGECSHTEGLNTYAYGNNQHVQGKYNISDTNNKYAHIVGNGSSGTLRSNAHTIDWNGLGWFAGGVKIGGTGQDDANAKELATKEYVDNLVGSIDTVLTEIIGE